MSRESLSQLARAGRTIHVVGIGGAGMSGIALLMQARGAKVTGSDREASQTTEDLARQGVTVHIGHDAAQVVGPAAVVYTAAAPPDNPELLEARQRGIPVIKRSEALGELVNDVEGRLIGVAGTHGKTTTTALTAVAIEAAGGDPTALVGGRVSAWGGNARIGEGDIYVVEADEYDRALLKLEPTVALVGNVEADHLECYEGSVDALEGAFADFAERAERVIVGADDAGAKRVGAVIDAPVWRAGLADGADIRLTDVAREREANTAQLTLPGGERHRLELRVPGLHNLRNAAMAVGAVLAVGADVKAALAGLTEFEGVARRFEVLGTVRGVTVVDDYAHHPSEVAVTLAAARQRFPEARVVAVFQPHLYSRTRLMGDAMGIALAMADLALVTDVYAAREEPIPGVSGKLVVRAALRAGAEVEWVPQCGRLADRLQEVVADGDVVLTLGAGDVTAVGRELLRRLAGLAA